MFHIFVQKFLCIIIVGCKAGGKRYDTGENRQQRDRKNDCSNQLNYQRLLRYLNRRFSIAVPNLNQIFKQLKNGKLFPFVFFKFLTKKHTVDSSRIMILGVLESNERTNELHSE